MNRLRELRMAKHISQVKMSMDLNISQAVISKYELGKSEPDHNMLIKLSEYFNVSVDYILGCGCRTNPSLTTDEEIMLSKYRSLDREGRQNLSCYADGLRASEKNKQK